MMSTKHVLDSRSASMSSATLRNDANSERKQQQTLSEHTHRRQQNAHNRAFPPSTAGVLHCTIINTSMKRT